MRIQALYRHLLLLLFPLFFSSKVLSDTDPLIIGIDADLSAVAVAGGVAITRGVELAVDEINAKGGILGRTVVIQARDHRGNPSRGLHNIALFGQTPNLLAVVGGVHTPVLLAEIEAIHKENLLMLVPWAAGTPIIDNGHNPNNVFRVSVRDSEAAKVLLKHARINGYTKVALILERTGWGRSNFVSLQQAAVENGISIEGTHWINWQQRDFSEDISAIKASGADAVVLVTNVPEGVIVLDEMARQDIAQLPVISHWGIASGQLTSALEIPIKAFNISVLQTFNFGFQHNSKAQQLLAAYQKRYGFVEPLAIEGVTGLAHAYDLTHLIAAAANKAGSINVDALRGALETLSNFEGAVKTYQPPFTDERHDALWAKDYFMTKFNDQGYLETTEKQ